MSGLCNSEYRSNCQACFHDIEYSIPIDKISQAPEPKKESKPCIPAEFIDITKLKSADWNCSCYDFFRPIYYESPDDGKQYIIITTHDDYIHLYDILEYEYNQKYQYPESMYQGTKKHHAILHKTENKLYIKYTQLCWSKSSSSSSDMVKSSLSFFANVTLA